MMSKLLMSFSSYHTINQLYASSTNSIFCSQYEEIYVQEGERENMREMLVF